ncbi:lysylphosphatidylglycerol synthase transmembrane domain-containing protein [Shivajiella indica]|uniref:Lysylphosphatidylglycerol synthase transmembrane domain-containing protein n=1 Tax=Shivajiella indica TaxID=872115 RepID=A0ABW5B3D7_9BACT
MRLNNKQWIQVLLSFTVAIWIFWFLYKDIKIQSLLAVLNEASFSWITASILVSLLGYWIRAWRWKLLLEAGEKIQIRTLRSFIALMIGNLTNLLVPRAGEVGRCVVLSKTEDQQVGKILGTVILERTIDMFFLILTMLLAFVLEGGVFVQLLNDLVSLESLFRKIMGYLPLLVGGLLVAGIFVYFIFHKYRDSGFLKKIKHFLRDLVTGFISLKKVNSQFAFWASSAAIWIIYYLMMLFVAWAIPSTASLSLSSLLMVMVMGSIGMIAPVQGGIGTFHALVAFILMTYGLTNEAGKIFAVIVHGSQVLTVIVTGLVSVGIFFKITAQKASKTY